MNIYAEKLKYALLSRGWSQADLARRTQLDPGHISRYVNGKITPQRSNFRKILDALEMDEREFMAGGDVGRPDPVKQALICEVEILLVMVGRLLDAQRQATPEAVLDPADQERLDATRAALERKVNEIKALTRGGPAT